MTFNVRGWLAEMTAKISECFGERLIFIGFQGSFKRGEATSASDIDLVVILDELNIDDLVHYREIVRSMPYSEKACGFISGKKEIQNWSKSDLFQFYYETEALYGDINDLITPPEKEDIKRAVKASSETLFHAACHSFVFDENQRESLTALYKMTFFILQAEFYLKNEHYVPSKRELLTFLSGLDAEILQTCINNDFVKENILVLYDKLISWCSVRI